MAELIEESATILILNYSKKKNSMTSSTSTLATNAGVSPKSSSIVKGLHSKSRPLRIMIIGQSGVGKTALAVRFITHRFIGEYDPNLEKIYSYNTVIDNEFVLFEILDTAGQINEQYNISFEANIRWADAFILMYSVTDKCSFDECSRLKFLINYNKRRRKYGSNSNNSKDGPFDIPVILVGNKIDQFGDRMVSLEDGQKRFREISCTCFHEISVRESIDQVLNVFRDACRFWRVFTKFPKLKRSTSEIQTCSNLNCKCFIEIDSGGITGGVRHSYLILENQFKTMQINSATITNPNTVCSIEQSNLDEKLFKHNQHHKQQQQQQQQQQQHQLQQNQLELPFRERASTDGTLLARPRRWRYPPPGSSIVGINTTQSSRCERRMSISMRGNNISY